MINNNRSKDELFEVSSFQEFDFEEILSRSKEEQIAWIKEMKYLEIELSSIKQILLRIIINNFNMTVTAFCEMIGYSGCSSLEQLWSR